MKNSNIYFYLFVFLNLQQITLSSNQNQLNEKKIFQDYKDIACIAIGTSIFIEFAKKALDFISKKIIIYNNLNTLIEKISIPKKIKTYQPNSQNKLIPEIGIKNLSSPFYPSKTNWDTVFLSKNSKKELEEYINLLFSNENSNGIELPRMLCLYGLPGTNKTEIIKGLASKFNLHLLIIDPALLDEAVFNKISIDNIIDFAKNKGPCIIHIKNIEKMSKSFFYSLAKINANGFKNQNMLLSCSTNNDYLVRDFGLHTNKHIKFMIVEKPEYEERYKIIDYLFTLYKDNVDISLIDIKELAILLNSFVQKDISLIIERAIETKKAAMKEITQKENSELLSNKIILLMTDVIEAIKSFKKCKAIVNGENQSPLNTGLTSMSKLIVEKPNTKFNEVIGAEHIKEKLEHFKNMLKDPYLYKTLKLKKPKAILFKGPPGTGKTLMARALAGEAGVTVIYINGSDFIHKYVGEGAKKVNELFECARIETPSMIIIDEIDAIGGKRSGSNDGGTQEYTQTLNALLTQLDGFNHNQSNDHNNPLVIGITNADKEFFEPALLRRFEEQYSFNLPNYQERLEMLALYYDTTPLNADVSLESLAFKTNGFSGAELEYLVNQTKYIAMKRIQIEEDQISYINFEVNNSDIIEAYNIQSIGHEIKKHNIKEKELFKTAIHEAGHTLCLLLQEGYPKQFELVTINPRDNGNGVTLGFAQYIELEEYKSYSKENLRQMIIVSLGGLVAEEIFFGKTFDGVSSDLDKATRIARAMVTKFGMGEQLVYVNDSELSIETKEAIEKILQDAKKECRDLLSQNIDILEKLAKELLIKKTIIRDEVIEIISKKIA